MSLQIIELCGAVASVLSFTVLDLLQLAVHFSINHATKVSAIQTFGQKEKKLCRRNDDKANFKSA